MARAEAIPTPSAREGGRRPGRKPIDREEKRIIRLCQGGDESAFQKLFDKFQRRVFAVAYNILNDHELAKDVIQEAFVRVFKNIHKFDASKNFYTWLYQIVVNLSIDHLRETPALALSGGERRRVEIARALASNPHFVLLDEPFAGIDPIAVGDIRDLVAHLKDRGIGVLITDHNVRETLDVIDRAYIIHDGMMLMEGAPGDIVGNEDVRRVYLGDRFNL